MQSLDPNLVALAVLGLLAALLCGATSSDVKQHRIPNRLVYGGTALACLLNAVLPTGFGFASSVPGAVGISGALGGLLMGLIIMLPLYALRAMGAGDVKLMAMVGAFLGPNGMLGTIVMSFLIGAVLSVLLVVSRGTTRQFVSNLRAMLLMAHIRMTNAQRPTLDAAQISAGKLPYAVAISAGTLSYILLSQQGQLQFLKIF